MKCEQCVAAATIHTTTIIAGRLVEHHVCREHAPQPEDDAVHALGQGTPRPLPPSPFYSDPELFDAVHNGEALRQFHTRLLPELAGSLLDENPKVRLLAVYFLSAFGADAEPALDSLRAALSDPDDRVRRAADYAMKRVAYTMLCRNAL